MEALPTDLVPDSQGNFKGIALGGKAGATWARIFGSVPALANSTDKDTHEHTGTEARKDSAA